MGVEESALDATKEHESRWKHVIVAGETSAEIWSFKNNKTLYLDISGHLSKTIRQLRVSTYADMLCLN